MSDITKQDMERAILRPEVFRLILELEVARIKADSMRAHVNTIAHAVLTEIPMYNDLDIEAHARHGSSTERRRLYDPKDLYLSTDEDAFSRYLAAMDQRTRAAGLKPDSMKFDYCPALVAEDAAAKLEAQLIEATAGALGLEIYMPEHRRRWIDSITGMMKALAA